MEKLLGNLSQGLLFIVSAPAGTGKNTLVNMLKEEFDAVVESISSTTRSPRANEVDGKDYFFLTREEFEKKKNSGAFLENAEVFGNYYGTSKEFVFEQQREGKHVVLVIDTQGAMQLKGKVSAVFIFLRPPSLEELRQRLVKRKTENPVSLEKRIAWAEEEIKRVKDYDYCIINEHLDTAYAVLRSILIAEERRVSQIARRKNG